MARGDGVHRTNVRNVKIADSAVQNIQSHNEREKEVYSNSDIVLERTGLNVHFKQPNDSYKAMFNKMVTDKIISVRGLKSDAYKFGELIFDVNSAYFFEHGDYDFAKQFYADAYNVAIKIVGSEEYIISAVLHADERNRALSDTLRIDVYHYHLHVVYIPIVEKEIFWTARCKTTELIGTVKERIKQVSMRKKWASKPIFDEKGNLVTTETGKIIYKKSYSELQDSFFEHMYKAGYTDIFRGEIGSTDEHLTIMQFKVSKEQARLDELRKSYSVEKEAFDRTMENIQQKKLALEGLDEIKAKPSMLSNKVTVDKNDFDMLIATAKKYITQNKKESFLQKTLDAANRLIVELKNFVENLERKLTEASKELMKLEFLQKENRNLSKENNRLRAKIQAYDEVISKHNLSSCFPHEKGIEEEIERGNER